MIYYDEKNASTQNYCKYISCCNLLLKQLPTNIQGCSKHLQAIVGQSLPQELRLGHFTTPSACWQLEHPWLLPIKVSHHVSPFNPVMAR